MWFTWISGISHVPLIVGLLYLVGALAALIAITIRQRQSPRELDAVWLLVLEAGFPWVGALTVSFLGGASIVELRYLSLAQLALFGFAGFAVYLVDSYTHNYTFPKDKHNNQLLSMSLAMLLILPPFVEASCGLLMRNTSDGMRAAVGAIQKHCGPDALVLVGRPGEVNRVHYYLHRAGIGHVAVQCRYNVLAAGKHTPHLGSLSASDLLYEDLPTHVSYLWQFGLVADFVPTYQPEMHVRSDSVLGETTRIRLTLHVRGH
jgi:hypothetical protein